MKINRERMAALLHANNLAFSKDFNVEQYVCTTWMDTPESTRQKWRKRADIFGKIVDAEVMEHD